MRDTNFFYLKLQVYDDHPQGYSKQILKKRKKKKVEHCKPKKAFLVPNPKMQFGD